MALVRKLGISMGVFAGGLREDRRYIALPVRIHMNF